MSALGHKRTLSLSSTRSLTFGAAQLQSLFLGWNELDFLLSRSALIGLRHSAAGGRIHAARTDHRTNTQPGQRQESF